MNVNSIAHHAKASSVLAVFAYPDDEQLIPGLQIKTAALTATKGEAGTPLPQISRATDLGWVRKADALKNTWAPGVEYHDFLDYPDSGLEKNALANFPRPRGSGYCNINRNLLLFLADVWILRSRRP